MRAQKTVKIARRIAKTDYKDNEDGRKDSEGGSKDSEDYSKDSEDGGHPEPVDSTSALLLGIWRGHEIGDNLAGEWIFEFNQTEAIVSTSGFEAYRGHYTINEEVVPHQADFYIDSSSVPTLIGQISLGIYRIEGNFMDLAAAAPGQTERPKAFSSSSDGLIRAWKLEKQ